LKKIVGAKLSDFCSLKVGKNGTKWAYSSSFCVFWRDYLNRVRSSVGESRTNILAEKFQNPDKTCMIPYFYQEIVKDQYALTEERCIQYVEDEADVHFSAFFQSLYKYFDEVLKGNDYFVLNGDYNTAGSNNEDVGSQEEQEHGDKEKNSNHEQHDGEEENSNHDDDDPAVGEEGSDGDVEKSGIISDGGRAEDSQEGQNESGVKNSVEDAVENGNHVDGQHVDGHPADDEDNGEGDVEISGIHDEDGIAEENAQQEDVSEKSRPANVKLRKRLRLNKDKIRKRSKRN